MTDKIIKDEGIKISVIFSSDKGAYEIMNNLSLANELESFQLVKSEKYYRCHTIMAWQ